MSYAILKGFWSDAGTFKSLYRRLGLLESWNIKNNLNNAIKYFVE